MGGGGSKDKNIDKDKKSAKPINQQNHHVNEKL